MSRLGNLLRPVLSLGLLLLLARLLEVDGILAHFRDMDPRWIAAALLLTVGQFALSAWRWRFTAARLGIDLPFGRALREYYLAAFLNQLLPGGVMGDVSRAWRHARSAPYAPAGPAIRAVILERASGQLVMALVALCALLVLQRQGVLPGAEWGPGGLLAGVIAVGMAGALAVRLTHRNVIWEDTRRALLSRPALPRQAAGSLLVVGSYLAVFVMAARALGIDTPTHLLLPLVALVILAMLVPVTLAGWGVREGAAALLWAAAGLPAAEGVAISVTYGVLVLVSTLPGAVVLAGGTRRTTLEGC